MSTENENNDFDELIEEIEDEAQGLDAVEELEEMGRDFSAAVDEASAARASEDDFLDQVIEERRANDPEFEALVEEASLRRKLQTLHRLRIDVVEAEEVAKEADRAYRAGGGTKTLAEISGIEEISDDDLVAEELEDRESKRRWEETEILRLASMFLTELRSTYELSQPELARELGIDVEVVRRLEAGP
jgi:DNA-binding transcriptional regulator YiaG